MKKKNKNPILKDFQNKMKKRLIDNIFYSFKVSFIFWFLILLVIIFLIYVFMPNPSYGWSPNPPEEMVVDYECGLSKTPIQDNATLDARLSFIPDVGIFSTNGEVQCIFSPDIFEVGQTYYGFVRAVNIWGLRGPWGYKNSNGQVMVFHYMRPSVVRGNGFDIRIENNMVVFEIF